MTSFVASEVLRNRHHEHEATKDGNDAEAGRRKEKKNGRRLTLALALILSPYLQSSFLS